jgi:ABC-type nitrate/sulfonate/bicarbonate transport system permease component
MAETGRLTRAAQAGVALDAVTLLRVAIVLGGLAVWELLAQSGWLYRDVVPSLLRIGSALIDLLFHGDYYFNLGVTAGEIGTALLIGGLSGMVVGIVLGGNRFLSKAYEAYLYYLGPTPKIIFFPVMIMWFGIDTPSKIALGTLS